MDSIQHTEVVQVLKLIVYQYNEHSQKLGTCCLLRWEYEASGRDFFPASFIYFP